METTIGKRLQLVRQAKKLSVEALADILGVKASAVYGLQKDHNKPSFDTIAALTDAFPDISMQWLIHGKGEMLRDGKNLTPVVDAPTRPAPIATQPGQVDFVQRYITRLENDLDAAAEREAYYQARIQELLGKPLGNHSAAPELDNLYLERTPIGFGAVAAKAPQRGGVVRSMYGVSSTVAVTLPYAMSL
ncbi:helix-turn-helix domain-containing protein [Hymenobacter aerilatus]|uniref:Helix-turn-helix domain-containing protein n=1 Tax=Hymenobacter aerilatus TaxID=2932251 RepID=A0A8T9T0Q7_9BACT|nr:helix-turn-helix domain-containing protein [Hymenobacter aerilatus]UOR07221.1 helix-turn-helix domain-containing protein [Hymenobacter aerilatus]